MGQLRTLFDPAEGADLVCNIKLKLRMVAGHDRRIDPGVALCLFEGCISLAGASDGDSGIILGEKQTSIREGGGRVVPAVEKQHLRCERPKSATTRLAASGYHLTFVVVLRSRHGDRQSGDQIHEGLMVFRSEGGSRNADSRPHGPLSQAAAGLTECDGRDCS